MGLHTRSRRARRHASGCCGLFSRGLYRWSGHRAGRAHHAHAYLDHIDCELSDHSPTGFIGGKFIGCDNGFDFGIGGVPICCDNGCARDIGIRFGVIIPRGAVALAVPMWKVSPCDVTSPRGEPALMPGIMALPNGFAAGCCWPILSLTMSIVNWVIT